MTADDEGFNVFSAGDNGFQVQNAGGNGFYVINAGANGVQIRNPVDDGIHVVNAGDDGIFVEKADGFSMNIQGDRNSSGGPDAHIAQIYNRNINTSPDVLTLKVGRTTSPGGGVNFITFYKGDDVGVGRIEGNGSGGVTYGTTGADFAECLTKVSPGEKISAGDVVGIREGKISLSTHDATEVMVITDRPAVLGNQTEEALDDEQVSFIGQVLVNVRGAVNTGDWIVASGDEDGSAIAITPSDIVLAHKIVGCAWERNANPEIKKVNTAVGLDHNVARDKIMLNMQMKIEKLQGLLNRQRREMKDQESINQNLQDQIDELIEIIK